MDGPDVRWEHYPHHLIYGMVQGGPGAALTEVMEARLKSTAEAYALSSELVNIAIQRAGGAWQGGAAEAATEAMRVLRGFDDRMQFTSNQSGVRAFGQSDGSGWVRANVPPVVEVTAPEPTGGLIDVIGVTEDYQRQQAAARQAEQRAREVMIQYTEETKERAAAMAPLAPVPQVVLDTGDPVSPPPGGGPPPDPRDPGAGPRGSAPVEGSGGGGPIVNPGSPAAGQAPPPGAPQATAPAALPGPGSSPVTPGPPAGPGQPPGGSGTAPPAGGFAGGRGPGGPGLDPRGRDVPGRAGQPATGRGPAGGGAPAVGRGVTPAGPGATVARGGAGVHGGATPFGVGPVAGREQDRERQARYGLPSAEHFEPDASSQDPHREGWHVAPEVIGDRDEDEDHR